MMSPILTALGEASAWTPTRAPRASFRESIWPARVRPRVPDFVLGHPDGHVIGVFNDLLFWSVQNLNTRPPRTDIAQLNRTHAPVDPDAFLSDLSLAYGPNPRLRLDTLLRKVLIHCVQEGFRGVVGVSRSPHRTGTALTCHVASNGALYGYVAPHALDVESLACQDILHPVPSGERLFPLFSPGASHPNCSYLSLPTSAHGVLEVLAHARDDGLLA